MLYAVASGNLENVRVLVAAGADVNGRDDGGMTMLEYAARHPEIKQELRRAGARGVIALPRGDSSRRRSTRSGPGPRALYRLSPDRRPEAADARLLWDMGQAVDAYVARLFDAGVLCPFSQAPKDEASERPSS